MVNFDEKIYAEKGHKLTCDIIETVQVNIGLKCNQHCTHCHLSASPKRTELMSWDTMLLVVDVAKKIGNPLIDITGGTPELNSNLKEFISKLKINNFNVQARTNLTILLEEQYKDTPLFYKENQIKLIASLPCHLEENVDKQRGEGVYKKSIEALKILNSLGYGFDVNLQLDLVYNPGGAFLASDQDELEMVYKKELDEKHGVKFSHLIAINNMPVGNYLKSLKETGEEKQYLKYLKDSFNPKTLDGLMCKRQICIGWDGKIYDCDFNLALGLPVNHGEPNHIKDFDYNKLLKRKITTANHCYGCTAGSGSSCSGKLT